MNPQLNLLDAPLEQRFAEFHADNPGVYYDLVRMTRQARAAGARRIGIAQLFEVLRWNTSITTRSWDGLKLNNSYRAFYARLIMQRNPDLDGIFETRAQRAA